MKELIVDIKEKKEKIEKTNLQIKEIAIQICKKFNHELQRDTLVDAIMEIRKLVKSGEISQTVEDILWKVNANQERIENDKNIDQILQETKENINIINEELKGVLF